MTQPYAPLQGLPGFGGGAPAPLQGLPGFATQPVGPQAVQQPGALPPALQGTTLQQFDAARPASDVGMLETVGTQAARGLLDAVLGSGALTGAAAESVGALGGWKGLEDFGRDLGRASSGAAAMEAASFLFGGGGQKGLSYAERTDRALAEQEQAWPMLSMVSRIGGGAALGIAGAGAGATAGAAATLRGAALIGAYEGAAGGAVQAYERNEALRDVLVSTIAGGALGAGAGAAVHGITKLPGAIGRAVDSETSVMRQLFGDVKSAADDVADAVREAGGKEVYDATKAILKERAKVLQEIAAAGDNPNVIRQAYDKATRAAGEKVSQLAGDFDPATWATKTPSPVQKLLHRTPLLDQVSTDLADDAARIQAARPSLDFEARVPARLLKDVDRPAAVAGLQNKVLGALEQSPDAASGVVGSQAIRVQVAQAAQALETANAPEAFAAAHRLVRDLSEIAKAPGADPITASFARRQAQSIADELGSDAWGEAGAAYRALSRADSPVAQLDAKAIREALKHADSSRVLPGMFSDEAEQTLAAHEARRLLGGDGADAATRRLLREASERAEKAHAAVTFDGAPARRVLDVLSGAGRNIGESYASDILGMGVGMAVGGVPGMLVARALSPVLGEVASAAFGKSVKAASEGAGRGAARAVGRSVGAAASFGARGSARAVGMQLHNERLDQLADLVASATPESATRREKAIAGLPPELQGMAGSDMQAKLTQLMQDIPKPQPNIRGKAYEGLSRADLRKANAMYEATVEPLSVFSDFAAGNVDYDKVTYAWKQYPGLKLAAQAGLGDILEQQLSEDERGGISDTMLSQLDSLFGFEGELQPTIGRQFASRIDQIAQAQQQENPPPRPGGKLQTPATQPTFTQRLSGQRG